MCWFLQHNINLAKAVVVNSLRLTAGFSEYVKLSTPSNHRYSIICSGYLKNSNSLLKAIGIILRPKLFYNSLSAL